MRRSLAAAIVSGFAGLALLGAVPASADSSGATSTSDTVPSCVDSLFYKPFDSYLVVEMTNNCSDTQRVTPTFDGPLEVDAPCYVLSPGEEDEFSEPKMWPFYYEFTGLVRC